MAALRLEDLTKAYGDTIALDGLELAVDDREVLAVLGPSGCGKSTLLRVIAGLERPDSGLVLWDERDLTDVEVHRRGFGLMFQRNALFPHRTVGENVAFGLRMQGRAPDEIRARASEALTWVGLSGLEHRRIDGLSGGEEQRVALARTLAPEPCLVMLDEPLGSLDRMLRERLIIEVAELLRARGTTALYVTHDHAEAEAVADRIAIMRAGRIVQAGTLPVIRATPADSWVAEFVGA